jgi:signal transduction histidine kinase/DNA-binding response OmpR family regulator
MGELIRSKDWSTTPLGPIETWSTSLRMMVSFLLANRFPLLLWWGPQYLSIYNDAYRPVLGNKHPNALGLPVSECWSEIWHILQPLIDAPFNGGPATWMEDLELYINRHGFIEETHFTVAYSPVPDETAPRGIGGVLATVHEITEKVIGERRMQLLSDLGLRVAEGKTAETACEIAAETLADHPKDIPFVLLYLLDADGRQAHLAGAAGVAIGDAVSPITVELTGANVTADCWPLADAVRREASVVVEDLEQRFVDIPAGPWSDRPRTAVVVPIRSTKAHQLAGLLVAGVSARLSLDHLYLSFLDLVASQVATVIANARSYEEERRRAEALAEIDRAKTAFFSNVSHEFRTPLTLMLGPLEGLIKDPGIAAVPAEQRKQLDVAYRNSLRLLRLVNTLLDFSRIEAGRVQARYQPTDLAALTVDLGSQFRSATERAGLFLELDCPPLPQPVFVDRDMWEKVVLNLLSNAFKFTFEGGITVALRADGGQAELTVRDTGVGIPAHELPRLFERFHRVEGSRGRTHEGTGIGLALVHELAKLHGGAVRVESAPGAGSAFIVTIPFGRAHLPADRVQANDYLVSTALGSQPFIEEALRWLAWQPDSPATAPPGDFGPVAVSGAHDSGGSILLADDNADMRDYVARLLAPFYEVRTAADGLEALCEIRRSRPDLLLSDVMMPQLDGFGLVREIRADPALADLPVILLSGRAGEEESVQGLEAGADDYLVKPFGARELVARIAAMFKMARIRREFEGRMAADLRGMTRLHEIGALCARADHKPEECFAAILDAAVEITKADKGTLQLLDRDSGKLGLAAQRGFASTDGLEAAAGGMGLRTGCQLLVNDVAASEMLADHPSRGVLLAAGVSALQATPLLSSRGTVLGILSTHFTRPHPPDERELRLIDLLARQASDYLERKQAEEALHKAQAQLQAVFDDAPLGVYLVDSVFRIRGVNRAALLEFGDLPDLIGQHFDEVIHRLWSLSYADEIVRHVRHTLETGRPHHVPERAETRRDRCVTAYFEWQISRVPLPDGECGVVCYFRDISAQVHARQAIADASEKLLRLNEQLETRVDEEVAARQQAQERLAHSQRMEALGQLAGGIAHDFNNVLQAVSGGLTLIEKRAQDAHVRRLAHMAGEATARGSAITGRLLSFARRGELRATSVELLPLLENLREMLIPTLGTAIAIRLEVPAKAPPLFADKALLETVLVNLAINARDAMPDGGTLTISVAPGRVDRTHPQAPGLASGSYLRIRVADTGKGMNAAILSRASEPFFTTKGVGQGTGLGLAMARGFAQQSGGDFLIESAPGRGTTVTLWFPEADGARTPESSEMPEISATAPARVLVADDDPMVREVLAWQLIAHGYRVTQVSDGLAALAELESGNIPDLLVTDFAMPGMNGLLLIEEARRHQPRLPALLLTGYADGNIAEDVLNMKQDLTILLRKPVSDLELMERAAALLMAAGARTVARDDAFPSGAA